MWMRVKLGSLPSYHVRTFLIGFVNAGTTAFTDLLYDSSFFKVFYKCGDSCFDDIE